MSLLYHYCSVDSLFHILESATIRLYNTDEMNDFQEIKWAHCKLESCLATKSIDNPVSSSHDLLSAINNNFPSAYIFCMSKNGDQLSQWRAYALDGAGVSIGFNPDIFPNNRSLPMTSTKAIDNVALLEVNYDEISQESMLNDLIDSAIKKTDFTKATEFLLHNVKKLYISFKNPAFSEENEVRLVHSPMVSICLDEDFLIQGQIGQLKHESRNGMLKSFFEFSFEDNEFPIREIILGPKCRVTENSLKLFLSKIGLKCIDINLSKASYR